MIFTQFSSVENYHTIVDSTTQTLDVFGDGSCLDLLTFDSTLSSVNNGALSVKTGSVDFTDGAFSRAVHGTDAVVEGMDTFNFTGSKTSSCAVSFWMRPGDWLDNGNFNLGFFFRNDAWGACYAGQDNDKMVLFMGGDTYLYISSIQGSDAWYHIVFDYDIEAETARIYVDGAEEYVKDSFTQRDDNFDSQSGVSVCGANCCGDLYFSDFSIDQVRFFDRSLSTDEVSVLRMESVRVGGTSQSASVSAYSVPEMAQSSAIGDHTVETLQQQANVDEYSAAVFEQSANMAAYEEARMVQSSHVATQYESKWFQQMSRVHDYRPYTDRKDVCEMFGGTPASVWFAPFEDSLVCDCAGGSFEAKGAGALFADGGKWGRAFRLDGQRWIVRDGSGTGGTQFCMALWFNVSGEGVVLDYADGYIRVSFDASGVLHITVGSTILYFSAPGVYLNSAVQLIVNIDNGPCRIYINGERVIDGLAEGILSYGTMILGASSVSGDHAVSDGRVDQFRVFGAALNGLQLMSVMYDATSAEPFLQSGTVQSHTVQRCRQSANVAEYHDVPFVQSGYLFSKGFLVFKQHASVEIGWRNRVVLRQSALILDTHLPVIIQRTLI